MRASGRRTPIAVTAGVLAVGVVVLLLFALGPLGSSSAGQACSSYPTPGTVAPAGTTVPAAISSRYSLLRQPQRPVDRLTPKQVSGLKASGVVMSGTRFLGDAAFGGRIYLVPAEHLLTLPIAPARCLTAAQHLIELESLPVLRIQYREPAMCIDVIYANGKTTECAAAGSTDYALLSVTGTPAFGLVPDGVSAVTVTYPTAPPTTLAVQRNAFVVDAPSEGAPACGLQWLDPTGNVQKVVTGCSYLAPQTHELSEYRAYVAGKLATLQGLLGALSAAVGSGNLAAARSAWLSAHLTWLEIGQDDGAYGAFGTLGGEIDGLAAGHRLGTADPGFTGFHRVEFDLWTRRDLGAAATDTATLQKLLARLMKTPLARNLPATATGIGNWLLRPHEVLEDALRDSLTADDDYGSGTDLASISADVAAVRVLLSELAPGLKLFSPHLLGQATGQLDALIAAVDATRVQGGWVSIENLAVRQREQVDADVDAALETLAPIPDLLTSTGSNAPGD